MKEIMLGQREDSLPGGLRKTPCSGPTQFVTCKNNKRAEIHMNLFKDHLKHHHANCDENNVPSNAVVIKPDPMWARSNVPLSVEHQKILVEECSEADAWNSYKNKRCHPMLCLWHGCNLVVTGDVHDINGIARGATATFEKVCLKASKPATPTMQMFGHWVHAVDITEVDHLLLRWQDNPLKGTFKLFPVRGKFRVQFPIIEDGVKVRVSTNIRFHHFPVLLNHAVTHRELQMKSLSKPGVAQIAESSQDTTMQTCIN